MDYSWTAFSLVQVREFPSKEELHWLRKRDSGLLLSAAVVIT